MKTRWLLGAALVVRFALPWHTAAAATVTITVANQAGAPAEDAVVVFDPLDQTPPSGHGVAVIDQVNKRFVPRVSVIRSGTAVSFPNSDSIRHQVYSFSNPHPFNLKLYAGSPRMEIVFDRPGMVVLGCNIHDTMVALVAVVDSPYFAKIPSSGGASIQLPPGRYRLRVWHAQLTTPVEPRTLTVGGDPLTLPLSVALDPARETVAAWPE